MSETMSFKLKKLEIPVEVEGLNGETLKFILRELDGTDRDEYLTAISSKAKYKKGRAAGVTDLRGMHTELLVRGLFYAEGPKEGKPVERTVLNAWPSRITGALHKKLQTISGLDDEESDNDSTLTKSEEDAKND